MYSGGWASTTCTPCPSGFYCSQGAYVEMRPCATGYYSFEGQSSCMACPAGYTCNEHGILEPCEKGYYCDGADVNYMSRSRPCPAGNYCHGGKSYTGCPSGTTSYYTTDHVSQGGISECTPVPPGKGYIAANHPPIDCPKGYYNDDYFNTGCNICPVGYGCGGGA